MTCEAAVFTQGLIPENQAITLHIDDNGLALVDRLGQNHLRERVEQLTLHHTLHGTRTIHAVFG